MSYYTHDGYHTPCERCARGPHRCHNSHYRDMTCDARHLSTTHHQSWCHLFCGGGRHAGCARSQHGAVRVWQSRTPVTYRSARRRSPRPAHHHTNECAAHYRLAHSNSQPGRPRPAWRLPQSYHRHRMTGVRTPTYGCCAVSLMSKVPERCARAWRDASGPNDCGEV